MEATAGYLAKDTNDGEPIVDDTFFTTEVRLPSGVPLRINPQQGAEAMWLGRGQAYVHLVNSQLLYMARGRGFYLVGRYTSGAHEVIASAFNRKNVDPNEVKVYAFFVGPRSHREQFKRFQGACDELGMKAQCRYILPEDGPYPYPSHPDAELARMHSLGIIMRV